MLISKVTSSFHQVHIVDLCPMAGEGEKDISQRKREKEERERQGRERTVLDMRELEFCPAFLQECGLCPFTTRSPSLYIYKVR